MIACLCLLLACQLVVLHNGICRDSFWSFQFALTQMTFTALAIARNPETKSDIIKQKRRANLFHDFHELHIDNWISCAWSYLVLTQYAKEQTRVNNPEIVKGHLSTEYPSCTTICIWLWWPHGDKVTQTGWKEHTCPGISVKSICCIIASLNLLAMYIVIRICEEATLSRHSVDGIIQKRSFLQ